METEEVETSVQDYDESKQETENMEVEQHQVGSFDFQDPEPLTGQQEQDPNSFSQSEPNRVLVGEETEIYDIKKEDVSQDNSGGFELITVEEVNTATSQPIDDEDDDLYQPAVPASCPKEKNYDNVAMDVRPEIQQLPPDVNTTSSISSTTSNVKLTTDSMLSPSGGDSFKNEQKLTEITTLPPDVSTTSILTTSSDKLANDVSAPNSDDSLEKGQLSEKEQPTEDIAYIDDEAAKGDGIEVALHPDTINMSKPESNTTKLSPPSPKRMKSGKIKKSFSKPKVEAPYPLTNRSKGAITKEYVLDKVSPPAVPPRNKIKKTDNQPDGSVQENEDEMKKRNNQIPKQETNSNKLNRNLPSACPSKELDGKRQNVRIEG
ncbi:uncharacterized protein LOC144746872 isoform X2 [Ciona intestinalis]